MSQNFPFCANQRPWLAFAACRSHNGSIQQTLQLRFDFGNLSAPASCIPPPRVSTSASCIRPHMFYVVFYYNIQIPCQARKACFKWQVELPPFVSVTFFLVSGEKQLTNCSFTRIPLVEGQTAVLIILVLTLVFSNRCLKSWAYSVRPKTGIQFPFRLIVA